MQLRPICLAIAVLLCSISSVHAAPSGGDDVRRPYIVQLKAEPLATYTGGIDGFPATKPAPGERLDVNSGNALQYAGYLESKLQAVQAIVADAPVQHQYVTVLNGFAAMLTDAEVLQLKASEDVASIKADVEQPSQTVSTPTFLGLDQPDGLWSKLGGRTQAGEDIVVGIIDSGVWPENPAFADRIDTNGAPTFDPGATLAYGPPPASWKGICQTGEGFTSDHCNNKLIGARYFDSTFRAQQPVMHWSDFRSPRDSLGGSVGQGGHGTHTASTAAGNSLAGSGLINISGMAPRARIAVYKVCWTFPTAASAGRNTCYGSDSAKAVEQAIIDGVNVLNFSISGGEKIDDVVEKAFLSAASAGVFVAASGGNSGPSNEVAHVSPWLTTVAASTHDRGPGTASVLLADGKQYQGASGNVAALPRQPLIRAEDAGLTGANADKLSKCYSSTANAGVALLDPAKAAGKVVICTRGANDRVDKSFAVKEAGGVGMVMVDNGVGLVAEIHAVPTVHVTAADGALIRAYAGTATAAVALSAASFGKKSAASPVVADFSSRGPNRYDGNVLKPDLTAPGVDVLAGYTPGMTKAEHASIIAGTIVPPASWQFLQGTSMSSPHVAGLAALLRQQHPTWSAAAIKSALMTTASATHADIQERDARGILPFGQGAGHVAPNLASDPGLVYDITPAEYQKYVCDMGVGTGCKAVANAGLDLNLPSISVSNVYVRQTVKRTVSNVGTAAATYVASASLNGYDVLVAPASLNLQPGESKSFDVTLTRTSAPTDTWQFGALEWTDGQHKVRSPLVARSKLLEVAPLINSDKPAATRLLGVTSAISGPMTAAVAGFSEVKRTPLTLAQGAQDKLKTVVDIVGQCSAKSAGTLLVPFTVDAGTAAVRFETFDRDTGTGSGNNVYLFILDSNGVRQSYSGKAGSNQNVTMSNPAPGNYNVCVVGNIIANRISTDLFLSQAMVKRGDVGGNLKAGTPGQTYPAGKATVGLSWSGLDAGKRYLGAVQWLDSKGVVAGTTVLAVDPKNSPIIP